MYDKNNTKIIKLKKILLSWFLVSQVKHLANKDQIKVSCFLSYAWGVEEHVNIITELVAFIQHAGVEVFFDRNDNNLIGSPISSFVNKILKVDYVIVFYSKKLIEKYRDTDGSSIIKQELEYITKLDPKKILCIKLEGVTIDRNTLFSDRVALEYPHNDVRGLIYFVFNLLKSLYSLHYNVSNNMDNLLFRFFEIMEKFLFINSPENIEHYVKYHSTKKTLPQMNLQLMLRDNYKKILFPDLMDSFEEGITMRPINMTFDYYKDGNLITKEHCLGELVANIINKSLASDKPVFIGGDAGIGKTILAKHIVSLWLSADTLLSKFEFVFMLQKSNLNFYRYNQSFLNSIHQGSKECTLTQLVANEFFPDFSQDKLLLILLDTYLNSDLYKCLWIMDYQKNSYYGDVPEFIQKAVKQFEQKAIIISSNYRNFNNYYKLTGFNSSSQDQYIREFFYSKGANFSYKASQLIDFMGYNAELRSVAKVPLHLRIMCEMYINPQRLNSAPTVTQIHEKIVNDLLENFYQVLTHTEGTSFLCRDIILQTIELIAFEMWKHNYESLPISQVCEVFNSLIKPPNLTTLLQKDILDLLLQTAVITKQQDELCFLCESFKIFLAGHHLLKTFFLDDENLVRKILVDILCMISNIKNYHTILIFISGLLGQNNRNNVLSESRRQHFWQLFCQIFLHPKSFTIPILNVLLRCVSEGEYHKTLQLYPLIKNYILISFNCILSYNEPNNLKETIKESILIVAKNPRVMDFVISIDRDIGLETLVYGILHLIYSHYENCYPDFQFSTCFISLRNSSKLRIKGLYDYLTRYFPQNKLCVFIRRLMSCCKIIDDMQNNDVAKFNAMRDIQQQKMFYPPIIDILNGFVSTDIHDTIMLIRTSEDYAGTLSPVDHLCLEILNSFYQEKCYLPFNLVKANRCNYCSYKMLAEHKYEYYFCYKYHSLWKYDHDALLDSKVICDGYITNTKLNIVAALDLQQRKQDSLSKISKKESSEYSSTEFEPTPCGSRLDTPYSSPVSAKSNYQEKHIFM